MTESPTATAEKPGRRWPVDALRWRVVGQIMQRDLWGHVRSIGMYLVVSLSLAAAALLLRNDLAFMQEGGLAVMSIPLLFPFFVATLVMSLFLAVSSLAAISREREQGTMQTLFYGPVDEADYVLGKFLAQLVVFSVMLGAVCFVLLAWAWAGNLHVSLALAGAVALAVACAAATIAGGIFLSVVAANTRVALLAFLAVAALFLAVQAGLAFLAGSSAPTTALAEALAGLSRVFGLVSPFAYLERGLDAVAYRSTPEYLGWLATALVFACCALGLAVLALRKRGVLR